MSLTANALNSFIEKQIFFPDPHLYCTPAEEGLEYEDLQIETSDGVTPPRLARAGPIESRAPALLPR